VLKQVVEPARLIAAAAGDPALIAHLTGMRIAFTPATNYRAYHSKKVQNADRPTWVQIDLKNSIPIEAVLLFPASERMYPGRDQYYSGEGFPLRFKIEACDDPSFAKSLRIADYTTADFPDPGDNITRYPAHSVRGRYVRLTASRLRPVKILPENSAFGTLPKNSPDFTLTLAKVSILSGGQDVAEGCAVTADLAYGNPGELQQLTRPARQDGEAIRFDNPTNVTDASEWKPAKYRTHAPTTGVTLGDGLFRSAMENNIRYLLDSYTTDDLLRQFWERTGKIKNYQAMGEAQFWEEDLAGSNAGRFLMGAGNTLRWIDHPELRRRMAAVVDGIAECRQPNGYIMAYPEDTIFYSERGAYTRAWLTHGLLEAGYAGDWRGFDLLRGYYDWFNQSRYLPEMLRGAIQGGQGMVANTRVAMSPVGKPKDVQVIQRYFQENGWLEGLAKREPEQIWQYPYDRPHCYLLTDLEAYLDLYRATGDKKYFDAVLGGWELYRAHWQQAGGSISIIEFSRNPPGSNYLHEKLGELCGSSFWVFLSQRFQLLHPEDERFATEIEKSIYNVAIANQDATHGLRYHTILEGKKQEATRVNTCCEGQGTRLIASFPEHIYSLADDGLYLHLFEASSIEWKQNTVPVKLMMNTRFPFEREVTCTVTAASPARFKLRVRVPSWATADMRVHVNGKTVVEGRPGSYISIEREWGRNDRLEFALPIGFRATRYGGADEIAGRTRYSIEYGPILYAAVGSDKAELPSGFPRGNLSEQLEAVAGAPLHYRLLGQERLTLIPYWQVSKEPFTCFPSVAG
jgi:uncharacterized protein